MKFDLTVAVREQAGKGAARSMRRAGKIPAVLYGQGESLSLIANPDDLVKILKSHAGSTALISLTVNGAKSKPSRTALLRDYQVDPITGAVLHADLFEISMSKPIRVKVPVKVIGSIPAGVKEGGVLHHNMRDVHVECLPAALPDHIEVDASALAIGSGIHVKEIGAREGIRFLDEPEQMVVSVAAPMSDAKLEALLTAGAGQAGEPEVVAKGKEVGAEGAAGAAAPAKAGAAAPAGDAKGGDKKEAAAPKAEKKEAEKEEVTLRLLVGLGNPGKAYAQTRHNVGMWAIERAAARWSIRLSPRGTAQRGSGRLGRELIELAGLLDWMNCSGPPVKGLLREFGIPPSELIVVHDDLDLEPGRLRIKLSGGYGGHNGIKSLIEALGTPQFVRLKIGVGRPAPSQDSADYVLEPVTKDELEVFEPCLERAVDALECLIHRGPEVAMNQFNVRERVEGGEQPD